MTPKFGPTRENYIMCVKIAVVSYLLFVPKSSTVDKVSEEEWGRHTSEQGSDLRHVPFKVLSSDQSRYP